LNRYSTTFGVALGVVFSSNKNLTAAVQYTTDPLQPKAVVNLTRSTTTATLTKTNHGLSVADSVVVERAGAPFDGTYAVASVVDQNTITYTVANSGATSALDARAALLRVSEHSTLTGLTADADGNFQFPPTACRLNCSVHSAGYVDLNVVSGGK
jgi:hypothetical protein